jgi:glutamate carboxypeptidase
VLAIIEPIWPFRDGSAKLHPWFHTDTTATMQSRRLAYLTALLLIIFHSSAVFGAGLTATERRVVAAAEAENEYVFTLLEKLVNINSGTMNLEGVRQVGAVMRPELEQLGFKVRWVPQDDVNRAGHLVAERAGKGRGKRMLLIGHLDTVFEKDSPFQKYERRGDVIEGPGVNDMKGGLAIMVAALRAMKNAATLDPARIIIVLTGDEEDAGSPHRISRADMVEAAKRSDVALEFESLAREDDGRDMGSIARRGAMSWTLTATAQSGHSSGIFSDGRGYGAAFELVRILDTFRRELREPNATYNVGLIISGETAQLNAAGIGGNVTGKTNIIPPVATAKGDLRTLSNEQTKRMQQRMREIVAENLPRTQAELTFDEGYPAMAPTEGSRAYLAMLNEINQDAGLPIMGELDPLRRGAGDIAFVAEHVDGLIGFGASGEGSHAPGETADATVFDRQVKRAALMMTRLSRKR